jgi:hypothetical protein
MRADSVNSATRVLVQCIALAVASGVALAAPPADPAAPPQLPQARDVRSETRTTPAPPRRVIQAPEQAPASAPPAPAAPTTAPPGGVVQWYGEPSDAEQLPPAATVSPETRIEQKRQANRIVEVIVTPAGSTHSYIMLNQEGQRPRAVQDLSSGLSLPQFVRIPVK